jgi:hypothetical protein
VSQQFVQNLRQIARTLEAQFLGKQETIRLMVLSVLAGEHIALIGRRAPPRAPSCAPSLSSSTAKYFEYLLTRFTEPNELFGPVDIPAFRQGVLPPPHRRDDARGRDRLPRRDLQEQQRHPERAAHAAQRAQVQQRRAGRRRAAALGLRRLQRGARGREPPGDLRPLPAAREERAPRRLPLQGAHQPRRAAWSSPEARRRQAPQPITSTRRSSGRAREVAHRMQLSDELLATYKSLVFQIRAEGVSLSDRRVVKLVKLMAASAYFDGRPAVRRPRPLHPQARLEHPGADRDPRGHRDPGARRALPRAPRGAPRGLRWRSRLDALLARAAAHPRDAHLGRPVSTCSSSRTCARSGRSRPRCSRSERTPRAARCEVDQLLEHMSSARAAPSAEQRKGRQCLRSSTPQRSASTVRSRSAARTRPRARSGHVRSPGTTRSAASGSPFRSSSCTTWARSCSARARRSRCVLR